MRFGSVEPREPLAMESIARLLWGVGIEYGAVLGFPENRHAHGRGGIKEPVVLAVPPFPQAFILRVAERDFKERDIA